jgi:hypothetical protein
MTSTTSYGSYIIDITDALLEHRQPLVAPQIEHLQVMRHNAVLFTTQFHRLEKRSLPDLLTFLRDEAMQHINIIISYGEVLLMDTYGKLPDAHKEALQELSECALALRQEIRDIREDLEAFMEEMGLDR